jgi:hypothetical protein
MRKILLIVAVAGAAQVMAACGGPSGPVGYLYSGSSGVLYIQWQTDSSGNGIQGTMTEDGITGTAPAETISVTTVPITGSIKWKLGDHPHQRAVQRRDAKRHA